MTDEELAAIRARTEGYLPTIRTDDILVLLGEVARLRAEDDLVSRKSIADFIEYKQRRNDQFAAYEKLVITTNAEIRELTDKLVERDAQLDALRAPIGAACVDHVALNGHIEIAEQCRDWLNGEDDPSGKLHDFVVALTAVIGQCDKQRRRANWYEAAYEAGKAKLIESATARIAAERDAVTANRDHLLTAIARLQGIADARGEKLEALGIDPFTLAKDAP